MVSNAPHNPTPVEVDEPTQPYSRVELNRLRQVANIAISPPQQLATELPEVTHVSTRGMLTIVPDDADEGVGDQAMEGWFELDGRWRRVCIRSFEHFGFSGAPPGMFGAVDASFVSGTIDPERGAALHPGPNLLDIEQTNGDRTPAPELEPEDSQPSSPRNKWKWWVLIAGPLALALTAWVFAGIAAGPAQPMTRDVEQVKAEVPGQPAKAEPPVPAPSDEPEEIVLSDDASADEPPSKQKKRKGFAQSEECSRHRKAAESAKVSGNWQLLLELAERDNCWSPVSKAKTLKMKALFELDRFDECVQLGARGGSEEIKKWLKTCQLNL